MVNRTIPVVLVALALGALLVGCTSFVPEEDVGVTRTDAVQAAGGHCDITVGSNQSIQNDGINNASSGDTVCVASGTYEEQVTITTDDIALVGVDPNNRPVLDGDNVGGSGISLQATDGVALRNLIVKRYKHGLYFDHTAGDISNLLVENVALLENDAHGLQALSAGFGPTHTGLTFKGVTAVGNDPQGDDWGRGIWLLATTEDVSVQNSQFRDNELVGLDFAASGHRDVTIEDVVTSGNGGVGIALHDARNGVFRNNVVRDGMDINGVENTEVTKNTFSGSSGFGIRIRSEYGAGPNVNLAVNFNNISGNDPGVLNTVSGFTLNAECNYWGHATGPEHQSNPQGRGDAVDGNVDFEPFSPREIGAGANPERSCRERGQP